MNLVEFFFRPPERQLTSAQRWGLVAGGLLTELNDGGYDSLWFPFGRGKSRLYLSSGWDTSELKDLLRIYDWLVHEGHRVPCAIVCNHVRSIQKGEVPYDASDENIKLYRWVSDNMQAIECSRLVAWDYSRLVNVARWGYTAGLIDQSTAWLWILESARVLQGTYSSWQEIGEDFLLGYSFWSGGDPPTDDFIAVHKKLSTSSDSPWRTTPWRVQLS